jgi:DNA-binding IclR family transcriptional regulator
MPNAEEPRPFDEVVENSGLNSSDVLATLFTLERKGIIQQLPGKQSFVVKKRKYRLEKLAHQKPERPNQRTTARRIPI